MHIQSGLQNQTIGIFLYRKSMLPNKWCGTQNANCLKIFAEFTNLEKLTMPLKMFKTCNETLKFYAISENTQLYFAKFIKIF